MLHTEPSHVASPIDEEGLEPKASELAGRRRRTRRSVLIGLGFGSLAAIGAAGLALDGRRGPAPPPAAHVGGETTTARACGPAGSSSATQGSDSCAPAPSEPAAETAVAGPLLVQLRSTPPGAMVELEDRVYGTTPVDLEWTGSDATPGRIVTFAFRLDGFRTLYVTRALSGSPMLVSVELEPTKGGAP